MLAPTMTYITLVYYIYGSVWAIPTYRMYRLYESLTILNILAVPLRYMYVTANAVIDTHTKLHGSNQN